MWSCPFTAGGNRRRSTLTALDLEGLKEDVLLALEGQRAFRAIGFEDSTLDLTVPHPVYSLGLEELAGGATVPEGLPTTGKFLLANGDEVVGTVESVAAGESLELIELSQDSSSIEAVTRALQRAAEVAEQFTEDFELRLVRAPALNWSAVWIHHSDQDLVVESTGFETVVSAFIEVLHRLQGRAEAVTFDDELGG